MEKYLIISEADAEGKVIVKRLSDGQVTMCKPSWLTPLLSKSGVFKPKSKAKALHLENLDWVPEGEI